MADSPIALKKINTIIIYYYLYYHYYYPCELLFMCHYLR